MDARQQFEDALKTDGGFKLIVKNTFFDVESEEEVPDMPGLQRASTAPAPRRDQRDLESDSDTEDDQDILTADVDVPYNLASPMQAELLNCESCPPSPAALVRDKTFNEFEHWEAPGSPVISKSLATAFPANQGSMYLQPNVHQWLPVSGPYMVPGQVPQPGAFVLAQVQTGYPLPEFDMMTFTGQPQTSMTSEVEPSSPASQTPAEDASVSEGEWEVLVDSPPFQPQTLSHWRSRFTGDSYVFWTVDARKLRTNDRLTVSPLFKLSDGHLHAPPLPFKMIISPKVAPDGKGSGSFKKAQGKAIIQLKCEAPREELDSTPITFYLSAGSGSTENSQQLPVRGPVTCNFAQSGVCGLPKESDTWSFLDVVDDKSQTFVVCLQVLSPHH